LKYGFVAIAKEAFDHDAKFITTGEGKDLAELGCFAFYALSMTLFCRYELKARARLSVRVSA
jgi:hypothetical protein